MHTFKVIFLNEETGERKEYKVEEKGICPAIDAAIRKAMLFGWSIVKAELIK